jgi:acyl dehydratase
LQGRNLGFRFASSGYKTSVMLYYEDFSEGQELPFGPHTVTRAEIVAFAAEFDPQPFHLDERAAAETMLGGLAASGWHTCALFMRMLYDGWVNNSASMGSPGVDTLKWLRPVRPGDTLSGRSVVVEMRTSKSKPDRGFIKFRHEVVNERGEQVMTLENPVMVQRRSS